MLTPALTIAKTASPQTAVPGGTVTYTITVTNTGQIPYTAATANAATVTDDLTGVTSNAAYQGDAAAAPTTAAPAPSPSATPRPASPGRGTCPPAPRSPSPTRSS